ncbi:MAG: phenylalanine--tRNA ligase subunit alpha [Propionibacteriaceae bacterium]|jgi:phenylalanyl-tRNA synthetase alpha chain|nr:phenylalanine--tRNA ligase subunit alpha [Propionibacteriaceae bacterium]
MSAVFSRLVGERLNMVDNDKIEALVTQAAVAFSQAEANGSLDELAQARAAHTGKDSPLRAMQRTLGGLSNEDRRLVGSQIQTGLKQMESVLAGAEDRLRARDLQARLVRETVDVTADIQLHPVGAVHPLTGLIHRMCDVFVAMGWQVAEGPEAEAEWLNFDALNFTADHPARFMSDTLFLDPPENHRLLRTHTSPVQMRALLSRSLPVYVVAPGKVYRADEYDATHLPVFHQIEGLAVDKGLSMADLKGTLDHLARAMFGSQVRTRLRPHYFPFTEPSAEMDLLCFVCHGASATDPSKPCRTCKSQGWIEWGGCGVVNPAVLRAAGVDSNVYSGFAFGMGVDRTVMFRNNASDLRDFVEADVRFSRQLEGVAR